MLTHRYFTDDNGTLMIEIEIEHVVGSDRALTDKIVRPATKEDEATYPHEIEAEPRRRSHHKQHQDDDKS